MKLFFRQLFFRLCLASFPFLFFSREICTMFHIEIKKIEIKKKNMYKIRSKAKPKKRLVLFSKEDFVIVGKFLDKKKPLPTRISVEALIFLLQCAREARKKKTRQKKN